MFRPASGEPPLGDKVLSTTCVNNLAMNDINSRSLIVFILVMYGVEIG